MPTVKLGSSSLTDISKMRNEHFDLDQRINELLSTVDIDIKRKLHSRLPGLVDEIKSEIRQTSQEV